MYHLQKDLLGGAICAALALGAAGNVRADAFAQSILVIDNFRLLHPNGTPYTTSDFAVLAGISTAQVTGQLDGGLSNAFQWDEFGSGRTLDVIQRSVGGGLAGRPENGFDPFAGQRGANTSFGYADARMTGAILTTSLGPAGALAQTRADAALVADGAASGHAALDSAASFRFSLGADETMTIAFSARPFTQAAVGDGAGAAISASAAMNWSISVLDIGTGATVFAFQPEQLNALATVSRSGGADGESMYAPGSLAFAATTDLLNAGQMYQITISQSSTAGALQMQPSQRLPEPATLAACGIGLLAMAALARRRRRPPAADRRPF